MFVYILSAAVALLCSLLLFRSFWRNGTRLLLWSGLCFLGLAVDNALLCVDVLIFPTTKIILVQDLSLEFLRKAGSLGGLSALIFGMVWDVK